MYYIEIYAFLSWPILLSIYIVLCLPGKMDNSICRSHFSLNAQVRTTLDDKSRQTAHRAPSESEGEGNDIQSDEEMELVISPPARGRGRGRGRGRSKASYDSPSKVYFCLSNLCISQRPPTLEAGVSSKVY